MQRVDEMMLSCKNVFTKPQIYVLTFCEHFLPIAIVDKYVALGRITHALDAFNPNTIGLALLVLVVDIRRECWRWGQTLLALLWFDVNSTEFPRKTNEN